MDIIQLTAPCHFGMESVLKREIYDLGYDITRVEDGRVTFEGDMEAICRSNIFLRTAERVLIEVGRFQATTFDELYENIKSIPWENWIPVDGKFWVKKASSVKSKLFSASDIQSIGKKAMVDRLKTVYPVDWFAEDGASFPVRIFILKDQVTVAIDTTGEPLHKRGYRTWTSKAPISETLAASLIMLTPWRKDRILVDPFCGSGTFLIEAALMAANIAPGMNRNFTGMQWRHLISKEMWEDTLEEARDMIDMDVETDLQGYDIDGDMVRIARENAK
ncbi:MAG: class I SAM-dependent RNA methyltransferase, partial [Lachnospiraceae bacterium]|nr:class I SAM-dependent RNA methyltransferase [Lachnospiraceae bacterium]